VIAGVDGNGIHVLGDEHAPPAKRRKIDVPSNAPSPSQHPIENAAAQSGSSPVGGRSAEFSRGPWRFSEAFLAGTQKEMAVKEQSLPALPTRPWQHRGATRATEQPQPTHRVRKNIPIPNTPDKLETPTEAPKFGKSALAGFFPWTGNDKEDVLNEANVRHGYFDRAPNPPEKEMGTAKIALYGAFKHRLGLDFLSVLYGLALERKGKHGVLSSTSNFRPPPRVTLTEAKRKAWLADLANAEIPLRRLSRTIPQGIRGQSLLDQCLSNNIPISRALWFIKCVGANEIRTWKRKGPGGAVSGGSDIKWLKEWTSFVGQFLESISQQSNQQDWKKNMQYALRLSVQLYLENLLDRDLHLDWILKGFAAADYDRTPFFLLLVQMYMPEIIRFRRRSRTLASTLVEKLDFTRKAQGEVLGPVMLRLRSIARTFAMSRPICFIMPEQWTRCKEVLRSCLDLSNAGHLKLFHFIEFQNERTAASPLERSTPTTTPHQAIIKVLDEAKAPFHVKTIMSACSSLCQDVDIVILVVLKWATTQFRGSSHRLYLAARLLRLWARGGYDIEKALLAQVDTNSHHATDHASLRQIIAELSRSRTFSVSKYLQAMILKGSARRDTFSDSPIILKHTSSSQLTELTLQICNDHSQVLTEVSLHQLPDHVRNLRKLALSRAGFSTDIETAVISHCKRFLSQKLSIDCGSSLQTTEDEDFTEPSWNSLSWTIKFEITAWLVDIVKTHCKVTADPIQASKSAVTFTQEDFSTIRDVLESIGDLPILADVLNVATTIPRESLLASVADTLDRHADAFSAIGAFGDLQAKLCTVYLTLRSSKLTLTAFVSSMISLNERYPTTIISCRQLRQDLIQGDRGSAAAACSPFSDGVAESLQQAGSHFFDDFEAILQTETNMNEQTMTKLFAVLTERIEKQNQDGEDLRELRALCQLLARLRLCRTIQSTELIRAWVGRHIRRSEWGMTTALIVDLVGIDCVKFATIVDCLREITEDRKHHPSASALATSLFTPQGNHFDPVQYRFETECMLYLQGHSTEALTLLSRISQSATADRAVQRIVESSLTTIALSEMPIPDNTPDILIEGFQHAADNILQSIAPTRPRSLQIRDVLSVVDDFSYPVCRLKLQLQMRKVDDASREEVNEAFFDFASTTTISNSPNQHWCSLLPAAGPDAAQYIRRRAEDAFIASMPAFLQSRSVVVPVDPSGTNLTAATKYLDIAFATNGALTNQYTPSITAQLIEKLSLVHRMLTSTTASGVSPMATTTPIPGLGLTPAAATPSAPAPDIIAAISHCLPLLLRMTCLQRPYVNTTPIPLTKPAQQEQIKLTVLLTTLALHTALSATNLPASILAVVSTIITVPTFTDEMHVYCARLLKDKMRDPRVMFLFGSVSSCGSAMVKDVGEGLQLHSDGSGHVGEWKQWVRSWEVIEPSGGGEGSSWVGLGLFEGRRV
jgi:mediator of RNA polymerase II transcription subunit 12, fungi type